METFSSMADRADVKEKLKNKLLEQLESKDRYVTLDNGDVMIVIDTVNAIRLRLYKVIRGEI